MLMVKIVNTINSINKTIRTGGYPFIPSYFRFFHLAFFLKYSPVEIFRTDLLNPNWSRGQKDNMISKEKFLRYQEKINPASHRHLTEDKIAFHQYCTKHNLPVPELVAVIDLAKRSYWGNGDPITTKEDFLSGLSQYPFDIICKPVHGVHGKDITLNQYRAVICYAHIPSYSS